ncbi:hypothetical protein ABWH92_12095 [Ahrensia marina]|uniref:AbiU2 domain-containing protein n=1 Tax=Ahrensia marina TaxID=1514904 RepID=UPI0035D0CF81
MANKPRQIDKQLEQLTAAEKLAAAKEKIKTLTFLAENAFDFVAMTAKVSYGDDVAAKIPPSKFANAYLVLRDQLMEAGIIKACKLLDPPNSIMRDSLPVVAKLLDDGDVQTLVLREVGGRERAGSFIMADPELAPELREEVERQIQSVAATEADFRVEWAEKRIPELIDEIGHLARSELYRGVKEVRDAHIAHSLTRQTGKEPQMKYGHESELVAKAAEIIESLYNIVNGVGFDLSGDVQKNAKERAANFWAHIEFKAPRE